VGFVALVGDLCVFVGFGVFAYLVYLVGFSGFSGLLVFMRFWFCVVWGLVCILVFWILCCCLLLI